MKQLFETFHPKELVETRRYINTPSEFAKRALFYVQETGYLKSLKSHMSKRSNLPSYLFIVVLSGRGTFTYQGQTYELSAHDCVLVNCMEYYTHQSDEAHPWELLWVHFHGKLASEYYQYFINSNTNIFHPKEPEEYIQLVNQLIELTARKDTSWEIIGSKLITDLITKCIIEKNSALNSSTTSMTMKLEAIKDYLDQNFHEKILLDHLANKFYISKYHLSREFKRIYGTTIVDYLTIKRITKAKEMLRFTDNSIEEIALLIGYPDASYFNKVFQKVEAMTASEYRKKW
jgi:AraC-like DNA-binding protein